ncbi:TetR/AcrR family transcriptional regulator [Methylobacterium nigriterrae]|uniref:TetR/AcrR family transcriptional regulator n=1 Tax=Methylobacterium nigriterrae TaxID=3127512 RepID=UPI003013E724
MTGRARDAAQPAAPPRKRRSLGGRPRRDEVETLTAKVLDAAFELFLAQGYGATSIETVASEAGVSKRTFYHRFPSKAALFEAVIRREFGKNMGDLEAGLPAIGGNPFEAWLHAVGLKFVELNLLPRNVAFVRLIAAESGRFPELARLSYDLGLRKLLDILERAVVAAVDRGEIAVPDTRIAADAFFHACVHAMQWSAMLGLTDGRFDEACRERYDAAFKQFFQGCRPGPS